MHIFENTMKIMSVQAIPIQFPVILVHFTRKIVIYSETLFNHSVQSTQAVTGFMYSCAAVQSAIESGTGTTQLAGAVT
ncbi:hypothetical protein E2L07_08170 [Halalkalibacterium halodurans]|nr:hypothetical protein E2L07_08170 [Halalkalibacterium halodurans]